MTNYELMFILDANVADTERTDTVTAMKSVLETAGAKITNEDVWGEKKLAYKINKSTRGYYFLYDLELDGKEIKNISKEFNLTPCLWRYMFVKKED